MLFATAARTFRLIPPETVASPARLRALATRSAWCWGRGRWSIGPDREFFGRVIPQVAWPVLPRIHCPTLVLRAERSGILSRRTATRMRDSIPRASLLEVQDTYHHLTLERPRVVADAKLAEETRATVERIAAGAPLVARWHKQFIRRLTPQPAPLTDKEIDDSFDYFDTEDFRIGYAAFMQKKKPQFTGR